MSLRRRPSMGLLSREWVFAGCMGMFVGILVAGLALPFIFGESTDVGRGAVVAGDVKPVDAWEAGATAEASGSAGEGTTVGTEVGGAQPDGGAADPTVPPPAAGRGESVAAGTATEEVVVAALLFDLGGVSRLGLSAPGAGAAEQREFYEAFVADINDEAKRGGPRIKAVYVPFNPLDEDDTRRACLVATEDAKAFAVLSTGGFGGASALCVTEQHGIPLMAGQGEAEETYRRSNGLLFTPEMSANRMARNQVVMADRQGRLKDRTIGIVTIDDPSYEQPVEQAMLPALTRLGYEVAHVSRLAADAQAASSQMPVEISQMRTKGVNTLLWAGNPVHLAIWFNQADGAQFRPRYIVSDIGSSSNDFSLQAAPNNIDVVAYTVMRNGEHRTGVPPQPEAADCRERYTRRTGQTIDPSSAGNEQLTAICGTVRTFVSAVVHAGTPLTTQRFSAAMPSLGAYAFPEIGGTISFLPGKFSGADFLRTKQYEPDCKCFIPIDQFIRAEP